MDIQFKMGLLEMAKWNLGDTVLNFYKEYVKPTKESALGNDSAWGAGGGTTKDSDDPKMTPDRRRELAYQSPIFLKGVRKKSMDSIRAWFKIETHNQSTPIQADEDAIRAFETRTNYKKKFLQAIKDAHIYGDGFLLIGFSNDGGKKLSDAPTDKAEPRTVKILNPQKITQVKYLSRTNRKMDLYHYVFSSGTGDTYIHPDRIQHIKIEEDSTSKLGVSKIDILRNTIKSKRNVDIAVGKILAWFSHGLLDIKMKDIGDDEIDKLTKVAATHPSIWVHDEDDFEIEVIEPKAIQPEEFMNFIVLNIASVLVMPVHVLTGIQVGRVTGAEIGFADYYRDIKDIQDLIYTPLITDLYRRIIEARGRTWKYVLAWQTVYVDELGEANIMEKRMEFVTKGVQAGVISVEEGRRMLNQGMVEIDVNKKPTPPKKPDSIRPPNPEGSSKKEEE